MLNCFNVFWHADSHAYLLLIKSNKKEIW